MAGVGAGRSKAGADGRAEIGVVDVSGKAAVADAAEAVVPAGERHPDLDFDVRVRSGLERGGDAAESGKIFAQGRRSGLGRIGRSERAGRNLLRQGDGG